MKKENFISLVVIIVGFMVFLFYTAENSRVSQVSETSQSSKVSQVSETSQSSKVSQVSETSQNSKVSQVSEISNVNSESESSFKIPEENLDYMKQIWELATADDEVIKAYARALKEGPRIPNEYVRNLYEAYSPYALNEPRAVFVKNQWYMIWTNRGGTLVINRVETSREVKECIYLEKYPELPNSLEELIEMQNELKQYNMYYGIAEEFFLRDLAEKGNLFNVRFYSYQGEAVAAYSLVPDGDLILNQKPAIDFYMGR